jgi:ribose 5-phosphate isomerase A
MRRLQRSINPEYNLLLIETNLENSVNKAALEKELAATEAVKYISSGMIVGLGTGSSAYYAIQQLAKLIETGLQIKAVPTSEHTANLALELGIPLIDFKEVRSIDVTIDGADEFTADLQLIKGGGGALFREKIVAFLSKKEIIIADSSKLVEHLGAFTVPVEVIPLALNHVLDKLEALSGRPLLRKKSGAPFITDNGNYVVDVDFGLIDNPRDLASRLNEIEGLLVHGLFLDLASIIIMGKQDGVEVFKSV